MFTVRFTLAMLVTVDTGEAAGTARVMALIAVQVMGAGEREGMNEGRWIPGHGGMALRTGLGESQEALP